MAAEGLTLTHSKNTTQELQLKQEQPNPRDIAVGSCSLVVEAGLQTAGADGYIVGLVTKFKEIAKETSATIPGKTITVCSLQEARKPLAYPYILFMVRDEQTGAGVVSALLVEKGGDSGVSKSRHDVSKRNKSWHRHYGVSNRHNAT